MEIRRCIQEKKRTERKQKVLLWILLVLLVLSGCGGGTSQTGSTADTAAAAASTAGPAEQAAAAEELPEAYLKLEKITGTIDGSLYTNPYFRLQIAAPEGFTLYGSNVTEQLQGKSRQEAARESSSFMDLYGRDETEGSMRSVTVMLGNIDGGLNSEVMDLTISTALQGITDTLAAEGAEDIKASAGRTSFLGREVRTVEISCRKEGELLLERELFLVSGSYIIELVFTGATPEEIELLQKCCSVIR